ncbi:MAG: hypothetical protein LBH93_07370 [Chitinispirillales bacterium]|jgi:plastocyanin|nr:hypothetical protein [Chitinispirillales bacterium]
MSIKRALSRVSGVLAVAAVSAVFLMGCGDEIVLNNGGDNGGDGGGGNNGGGNNGGGGGTAVSRITIKNNTSQSVWYCYVKPSTSTNWGSDVLPSTMSSGESRTITFSQPLPANSVCDIRISISGYTFGKYGLSMSNNMTVTFTNSDLDDGSGLPSITVQNRSGVNFNAFYIRPSSVPESSSDWGKDYGSLSNNGNSSISIPIPSSNYTEFDIQMRTLDPTASSTYTRNGIVVSDGMTVTILSTDSDQGHLGLPIIVVQNNTSQSAWYCYVKPSTSTDWGSDVLSSIISIGESRTVILPQSLSVNSVYDIRISISGYAFGKYGVTMSDGMTVTFTNSDLDDGSSLPNITVQNRSGVNFNAIYVRPSSASSWGKDYGALSNNSNKSISIPIPSSNYTTFDIQMRTSDPTVSSTYTKNNVTVSNDMTLIILSTDSDGGNKGRPVIVVQNSTSQSAWYCYIKLSTSTDWGPDVLSSIISSGESRTITLPSSLSVNSVCDIRISISGYNFIKYNVTISDGMTITFTNSDVQ